MLVGLFGFPVFTRDGQLSARLVWLPVFTRDGKLKVRLAWLPVFTRDGQLSARLVCVCLPLGSARTWGVSDRTLATDAISFCVPFWF